jgi:uncharacterized protein DUF6879
VAQPISQDEFNDLLRTFSRSAFRLETRERYALGYERVDFQRFLDGRPTPPPLVGWWQPWLDQIARFAREGKTIARVRVLAEPPTDYQRWEVWAAPWHAQAGENIRYMPRSIAKRIGLPLDHDWWLLDDERLIVMRYTNADEVASKELITDPGSVAPYLKWRDLAVRNATPAGDIAAA